MDLSQLEVFLAVAREGRFSRAAEKLHRTQSAVSQSIRKLEDEIGEPLFDRSSRDGLLTDAGHVLQEYAERLLNLRNDAQEALVELRELHKGKLAIAANEFTALYLLPVLAEFRRLHPMIKVTVQRALGSHIPDDVLRHNSELGVLTYDPQESQLRSVVVYLDELIFVVPPSHPLAGERQVSIRQLGAESFVAHIVSSPYREKVIQTGVAAGDQRGKRIGARRAGAHSGPRIAATPQTAAGVQKVSESLPCCASILKGGGSDGVRAAGKIPFSARTLSVHVPSCPLGVEKGATTPKVHEESLTFLER